MEGERQWYCVRTQTKRERLALENLRQLEIEVLCPRIKYRKATRRGKVWWSEAMFPGYLFAKFDRSLHERAVKHTAGVLTLVRFGDDVPAIPEPFIQELQTVLHDCEKDEVVVKPKVEVGDQLEVAYGAMQGEVGEVVEVLPAQERVRMLIEMMGQPQVIDVDLFSLILPDREL